MSNNSMHKLKDFNAEIETFGDFLSSLVGNLESENKDNIRAINKVGENDTIPTADFRKVIKNGVVQLEMVVAGHEAENIRVEYNRKTNELRVRDISIEHSDKPWYYNSIDMTFKLPVTTDETTFYREIRNGVLTVSALYKEVLEAKDEFTEI